MIQQPHKPHLPFRSPLIAPHKNNIGINAGKAFGNNQLLAPKNAIMVNKNGRMF